MKRILIIVIIGFVFSTVQAQMDNPLKEGMLNTVKLPSGEVIYDLNGEWDAVYDSGFYIGAYKDIVKITQNGNQFVGIYLLEGDHLIGKNEEKIRGKVRGNVIDEVFFYEVTDIMTMNLHWAPSEAEISEDGNEIVIKRAWEEKGATIITTLSLKRK
jgi:hypothetical protein